MPLPEGLICTPPHLFPLHLDIAAHSTKVVSNFLSNYPLHLPPPETQFESLPLRTDGTTVTNGSLQSFS